MTPPTSADETAVLDDTRRWVERAVIGLGLCPFAKAVHATGRVRYVVSQARDEEALRSDLLREMRALVDADPLEIDTTLLIHPFVLTDFFEYNFFLGEAERALQALDLVGTLQVASFHPDYRFARTRPEAMRNYTNRSPYPMLHLLREDSVTRAVEAFPDPALIYEKNEATLDALGPEGLARVLSGKD
jgi:uncharacterized protein